MTGNHDVAIAGAGLGGLAAAIFLRKAGLSVLCIEPEPFPRARVGESLDWSSPRLLQELGLSREFLIDQQIATYKRNIQISPWGGSTWIAQPEEWFRSRPIGFEIMTLHVDRAELDLRLYHRAEEAGAEFVWDRVAHVHTHDDRVIELTTGTGRRITAAWFLDNSGQARLFARAFRIPKIDYGQRKVCLWTYFNCSPRNQGTSFYADTANDEYLTWIWEIPITPSTLSVGCVMPAWRVKQQSQNGVDVDAILRQELLKYPRLAKLLEQQQALQISRCAFRNYVSESACGANWLMIGESASLPDPLTANGVTACFRHARESTRLIQAAFGRRSLSVKQQTLYNSRVRHMGHAFNHSIETSIYDWPIRKGLGALPSQKIYTAFSYSINALYTRFAPEGWITTRLFQLLLYAVGVWMESWAFAGRIASWFRRSFKPQILSSHSTPVGNKYEV